jgi:hypothetical protein
MSEIPDKKENFESNYSDYIVSGNNPMFGAESPDTISFTGSGLPGGMSDQSYWDDGISLTGNPCAAPDHLVFNAPSTFTVKSEPKFVISPSSKNHFWKYNEDKILKEVEDYVTTTYHGHYCGDQDGYADIQTIDLMAAKKLAAGFCQANILKYGSRYGDKDGRNKRDLLKVIHYAMLLLHFDGHYSRKDNGLYEFR